MDWLKALFVNDFMPHGHCYFWRPDVLWLNVGSDAAIAVAYFSIPLFLAFVAYKRPERAFNWVLWMFSGFILLCGATHVIGAWTVWQPVYLFQGTIKAATAAISLATAAALWLNWRGAVRMPTLAQHDARVAELHVRRQVEQDLRRSNRDLEQFAYVASHDLQEPLRMVTSYTQLLAERYADRLDADAQEFIGYAVDGARRMQQMVNDLLALSRVDTRTAGAEAVALDAALAEALANLGSLIEESAAEINHQPLPTVHAEKQHMVQLLQNLLTNAMRYRHPQRGVRITISARRSKDHWQIAVADNGIGIEREYHERIFDVFRRLHGREQYQGTGIGLAICKRIVEREGGRIWVESAPGEGSTFRFTLPAAPIPPAR